MTMHMRLYKRWLQISIVRHLKLNEYTFRGSNSAFFVFASLRNGGQPLKERICSSMRKFFLSKKNPLQKIFSLMASKQEIMKVVPHCENGGCLGGGGGESACFSMPDVVSICAEVVHCGLVLWYMTGNC